MPLKGAGKRRFGKRKQQEFVKLVQTGLRRTAAAEQVGVAYSTVYRHLKDDTEFAEAVDEAEMHVDEQVVDALFEAATSGNVTACQVWLYNRRPEEWADKRQHRLQHTGFDGGPIAVDATVHHPDPELLSEILAGRLAIGDVVNVDEGTPQD